MSVNENTHLHHRVRSHLNVIDEYFENDDRASGFGFGASCLEDQQAYKHSQCSPHKHSKDHGASRIRALHTATVGRGSVPIHTQRAQGARVIACTLHITIRRSVAGVVIAREELGVHVHNADVPIVVPSPVIGIKGSDALQAGHADTRTCRTFARTASAVYAVTTLQTSRRTIQTDEVAFRTGSTQAVSSSAGRTRNARDRPIARCGSATAYLTCAAHLYIPLQISSTY